MPDGSLARLRHIAIPRPEREEKVPLGWTLRLVLGASLALWVVIVLAALWAFGGIG